MVHEKKWKPKAEKLQDGAVIFTWEDKVPDPDSGLSMEYAMLVPSKSEEREVE